MVVVVAVVAGIEGLSDGTKTIKIINEGRRRDDLEQIRVFSLVLPATNGITPTLLARLYALLNRKTLLGFIQFLALINSMNETPIIPRMGRYARAG